MTQDLARDVQEADLRTEAALPELQPSQRWVRVQFNDSYVADSKHVLLHRVGHRLTYYFPKSDVRTEWLSEGRQEEDGRQFYDLTIGDAVAEEAAWSFADADEAHLPLHDHIAFDWRKMDHWYEEEEEVFVHPRDPYHRIDAMASSRQVKVVIDGVTVAESGRPLLVFETGLPIRYYLPKDDVRVDLLEESKARTGCPYKGFASYWHVTVNGEQHRNIVWCYEEPFDKNNSIKGLLCFYNEKVDLYVDGQREERPETPWS
ncbi:MAG: DUF427 domain-containing protein [Candidatus Promineifilaceae bacterium]|nr:DUF427 domain-containing protein [Candidatus Promineifilaceae bacterium]